MIITAVVLVNLFRKIEIITKLLFALFLSVLQIKLGEVVFYIHYGI